MGKLTSIILGFTSICIITFYYLSGYYSGLIDWVGPLFGPQIIYAMGFLFLFFGNPLSYPLLLVMWIFIGVLVAIGSRKGLRSAGAAISVFFIGLSFFGIVAASMIIPLISGSTLSLTSLTSFPPPPPGVSITAVLSAPVISAVVSILSSLLSGFSLPGLPPVLGAIYTPDIALPTGFTGLPVQKIMSLFLYPMIGNLLTVTISAGLFGAIIRKAGKKRKVVRMSAPVSVSIIIVMFILAALAGAVSIDTNTSKKNSLTGVNSNTILQLSGGMLKPYFSLGTGSSIDPYYESVGSYVGTSGSLYNIYAFAHTYSGPLKTSDFFNNSGVSASALTLFIGSSGLQSFTYGNDPLGNFSGIPLIGGSQMELLPHELLASVYPGNISSTSGEFNSVLNSIQNSMGISLSKLLVYQLNASGSNTYTLYLYGSDYPLRTITAHYVNYTIQGFSGGGLINALKQGIDSGNIIPGTNSSKVSGTVLFSAYVDTQFSSMVGNLTSILGNLSSGYSRIAVTGAFTVSNHEYHSSSSVHSISLARTLGFSSNLYFNRTASGSLVFLAVPNAMNSSISTVNYTAYFNNPSLLNLIPLSGNITSSHYNQSTGIDTATVSAVSNWTYPRYITVGVSMIKSSQGRITVSTRITNLDNVTVSGISVNETAFSQAYGSYISGVNGQEQTYIQKLLPGASESVNFSFIPGGVGNYTLSPVTISYKEYISGIGKYVNVNDSFTGNSIYVSPPNFINVANHVEYVGLSSLGTYVPALVYLTYTLFPGFYLFDLIIALIFVLDIYIEFRAYKKRKNSI